MSADTDLLRDIAALTRRARELVGNPDREAWLALQREKVRIFAAVAERDGTDQAAAAAEAACVQLGEALVEEIAAIQAKLADRYEPRPGETWADAAAERGRLEERALVLILGARAGLKIDRLQRAELVAFIEMLERIALRSDMVDPTDDVEAFCSTCGEVWEAAELTSDSCPSCHRRENLEWTR